MSAWAAEIDLLCLRYDLLFVASVGNILESNLDPLDARLNLPDGKASYLLQEFSQLFCVEKAFGVGAKQFEAVFGQRLSVDTLESINRTMGEQAGQYLEEMPRPKPAQEGAILVATADGKGVPLVKADAAKVPAFDDKERRPGNRRMATLGCVYTVDAYVRTAEQVVAALFRDNTGCQGTTSFGQTSSTAGSLFTFPGCNLHVAGGSNKMNRFDGVFLNVHLPSRESTLMMALNTVRIVCPHDCPDTCSMVVTVEDGKAVKLRGDRDHPFTDGFLCKKVNRYLDRVYHPKAGCNIRMIRTGPKGSGQFRAHLLGRGHRADRRSVREHRRSPDGPQAILPYSYAGTMGKLQGSSLDRRFFHRLGASLLDRTICATAGAAGCDITLGTRAVIDPEAVIHSRYIINWGSNTSVTNMHLWTIMHRARKLGAKIVTIDPYRCKTAEKSDWWIPIRPGTDAALALGIMHILFRDGLQDDDYLQQYCLGADELRERALSEYPPEKVSRITGISVADIEKLAHEYGTTSPV